MESIKEKPETIAKKDITKERNYGLDVLRILAMVMIVMLHYFQKGGMLVYASINNPSNVVAWFLEACCNIAVNCYVLISAYFLIKAKFKIKKVIQLVIEVVFYSVIIYFLFVIFNGKIITIKDLLSTFLPVLTQQYWFISTYLVMYILSPFLNMLIEKLDKPTCKKLTLLMVGIFSIWPTVIFFGDSIDSKNGYSISWFICLYFVGSYIRLHKNEVVKNRKKYLGAYLLISLIITASKFILSALYHNQIIPEDYSEIYYRYNSFTMLASSICLFMFFKDMVVKRTIPRKIVSFLAPCTFGVYLIHEHPCMRTFLYHEILHCNDVLNSNYYVLIMLGAVATVYIVCTFIEFGRIKLFNVIQKGYKKLSSKS